MATATATAASKTSVMEEGNRRRRSSAARELHLTKYYFYQQQQQHQDGSKRPAEDVEKLLSSISGGGPTAQTCVSEALEAASSHEPARGNARLAGPGGCCCGAATGCTTGDVAAAAGCQATIQANQKQRLPQSDCSASLQSQSGASQQTNSSSQPPQISPQAGRTSEQPPKHHHHHLNPLPSQPLRRNSSPVGVSGRQLPIEEQLRRLLELKAPVAVDRREADQAREAMKRSSQQRQDQQRQSSNSNNKDTRDRMSQDDRLMIFMLASRSTSTSVNSPVERNARILKWLNNCRSAN